MKKVSTVAASYSRNFFQPKLTLGLDLGDRSGWYCVLERNRLLACWPHENQPGGVRTRGNQDGRPTSQIWLMRFLLKRFQCL